MNDKIKKLLMDRESLFDVEEKIDNLEIEARDLKESISEAGREIIEHIQKLNESSIFARHNGDLYKLTIVEKFKEGAKRLEVQHVKVYAV